MKYGVKITYSWGDEKSIIKCESKEAAWKTAKNLAIKEAEIVSEEHEWEKDVRLWILMLSLTD